jgi:response regulator RpfG family c-di-GMP phosphodiesterase
MNAISTKAKVLLVDDEERILRTLGMLLRMQYDVISTTDGHEALRILQRERIHLLISDQRMPIMTGTQLLRQAKQMSPNTMRILLTGYADVDAAVDAVNEGEIFRYINKPWGPKELRDTIAEAVAIAGKLEQAQVAKAALDAPKVGLTCLVLDEDVAVFEAVKELLGDRHQVVWRTTMASALTLLATHQVAILVSELQLADGDASVMIKTLKQEYPELQTIVHTSFKDTLRVASLINQAQVYRYLPKPLRKGLLGKSLESTVERYRQLQAVPVLRETVTVAKNENVEEKAVSNRIADYLRRLRVKGLGMMAGNPA